MTETTTDAALVAEAVKKAAVAWLAPAAGAAPRPVWCVPLDGRLYTVTGPGEQRDPGLADGADAIASLRGDHGGTILAVPVRVTALVPGGEAWEEIVPQLAQKRLNLPGTDATVRRWAAECAVWELAPVED